MRGALPHVGCTFTLSPASNALCTSYFQDPDANDGSEDRGLSTPKKLLLSIKKPAPSRQGRASMFNVEPMMDLFTVGFYP